MQTAGLTHHHCLLCGEHVVLQSEPGDLLGLRRIVPAETETLRDEYVLTVVSASLRGLQVDGEKATHAPSRTQGGDVCTVTAIVHDDNSPLLA